MITLETINAEQEVPASFTCDRCGKTFEIEKGTNLHGKPYRAWNRDFVVIKAEFGYHSDDGDGHSMDGYRYEAVVCDACFLPAMAAAGIELTKSEMW